MLLVSFRSIINNMAAATRSSVKLALIQLAVTSRKVDNLKNAQKKIAEAAKKGAKLIVLPECFNAPYGTQYFKEYSENIPGETYEMLKSSATEHEVYLIGGSIPEKETTGDKEKLYNTCTVFNPNGEHIATHRKVHLFDIDIPDGITFIESSVLTPGNSLNTFQTSQDYGNFKVGLGICYDVRFAEMAQIYERKGCRLLIYPGAFNKTTGPLHWRMLMQARAVDNQVFVAGCSPAFQTDSTYPTYGHSLIVNPWGKVLVETDDSEDIIYADIDVDLTNTIRQQIPIHSQKRHDIYDVIERK